MSVFDVSVSDPQKYDSKSVTYLIKVRTDVPEYSDEGVAIEGSAARELVCRRRFGEMQAFRKELGKIVGKGSGNLPELPAKNFFNRFDPKVIEERRQAFEMKLTCVGLNEGLRVSDLVRGFLSNVPPPDYSAVEKFAMEKAQEYFTLPESEWTVKSAKEGVTVAVRKSDHSESSIVMVRTKTTINKPMKKVYDTYNDLSLWPNWSADTSFRIIENVSDIACVTNVTYKTPVIDNRDSVYYTTKVNGTPMDTSAKNALSIVATSVQHPLCPKKNGLVRAQVYLTSTIMIDNGANGTDFVSIVHADPKGKIPPAITNQVLGVANQKIVNFSKYCLANL